MFSFFLFFLFFLFHFFLFSVFFLSFFHFLNFFLHFFIFHFYLFSFFPPFFDEFPPLFMPSEQFPVDPSCLCDSRLQTVFFLTIQFSDTLTPEVQQYLWSVSLKCVSMKFVAGGSPLCVGIRSFSFSFDRCCHSLFIQMSVWFARTLFLCNFSVEGCLSQLGVHICCMAHAIRVEGSALDSSALLSHETLSAPPYHLHLQCQHIFTYLEWLVELKLDGGLRTAQPHEHCER